MVSLSSSSPSCLLAVCLLLSSALVDGADMRFEPRRKGSCSFRPTPTAFAEHHTRARRDLRVEDLPASWDWRDVNGTGVNMCTRVQNQFVPSPCGSCWAFATTGALSDRFNIAAWRSTGKRAPDITLAPQVLLNCGMELNETSGGLVAGSCDGGAAVLAHAFMQQSGITDDTCAPYAGMSPTQWGEVECVDTMCRVCDRFGTCSLRPDATRYYAAEHGVLSSSTLGTGMVAHMMQEIISRGPIVCAMWAHSDSFENYRGGVLVDRTRYTGTTHDLVLAGWGEEAGTQYWIGRNSFGTIWGEAGWFRVERGTDTFNMEEWCYWATPRV